MATGTDPHTRARGRRIPIRTRSGISRLISSLGRLASIQIRLIAAELKLSAQRFFIAAGLIVTGITLIVLAIVFVHIGVFEILERYLSSQWVWLIYAGTDTLAAVGLFFWARWLFRQPLLESTDHPAETPGEKEQS